MKYRPTKSQSVKKELSPEAKRKQLEKQRLESAKQKILLIRADKNSSFADRNWANMVETRINKGQPLKEWSKL